MAKVKIYSSLVCPYCYRAKHFFKQRGIDYEEIRVDLDFEQRRKMQQLSNRTSVPQIFIDEFHVGGFDDLISLNRASKLEQLLNEN